MAHNFLSELTGSFAMPAAENPIVATIVAAYRHHKLDWRYINCEVAPEILAAAVAGGASSSVACGMPPVMRHVTAPLPIEAGWRHRCPLCLQIEC